MTDQELDRLQSLSDAATEGPWIWYAEDASMVSLVTNGKEMESVVLWATRCDACYKRVAADESVAEHSRCGWPKKADSDFLKEVRTAVPKLIAEIRRLRNAAEQ